jgi:hypothetical protein
MQQILWLDPYQSKLAVSASSLDFQDPQSVGHVSGTVKVLGFRNNLGSLGTGCVHWQQLMVPFRHMNIRKRWLESRRDIFNNNRHKTS